MSLPLTPTPRQQFLDSNGDPLAEGLLYSYLSGTDTPEPVYSDADGTPHTNPVELDAGGWATIYLGAVNYKFVLKDSDGVTIWTVDPVSGIVSADTNIQGTAGEDLEAGEAVYLSDGSGGLTAGRWYLTDADQTYSSSLANKVGFAFEDIASGSTGSIMISGRITGLSGLTAGTVYYASSTAGGLTSTAPTNAQPMCVADSVTTAVVGTFPGWINLNGYGVRKQVSMYSVDFQPIVVSATQIEYVIQNVPERFKYQTDFIQNDWTGVYTGTAAALEITPSTGLIGIQGAQTGATINSVVTLHPRASATTLVATFGDANSFRAGVGSNGTATRSLTVGCGTDISSATFGTDSVYFLYNSSVSANWVCRSRAGGVETSTTTSVAFTANGEFQLFYEIDVDEVTFYINVAGVAEEVAVHSTNVPAITVAMTPGLRFENLAAANYTCWIDYCLLTNNTSGR